MGRSPSRSGEVPHPGWTITTVAILGADVLAEHILAEMLMEEA